MRILDYLKASFKRKIAQNFTQNYPILIEEFALGSYGNIRFANWENPLVERKVVTEGSVSFFKKYVSDGDLVIICKKF